VAVEDESVIGAGGGGITQPGVGEIFVLYLDPTRRGEGIGTRILDAITEQQRAQGTREQWVSVEPENTRGLPFYFARGFEVQGQRTEWGTTAEDGHVSLRLMRRLQPQ
jgi:ribosomal protein S18 acetylase RimI-like enzyme